MCVCIWCKNIKLKKKNIFNLFIAILLNFIIILFINFSYLEAVRNGEPTGILLRMAKDIDAAPALLARNVLEKYCMHDDANGNNI